MRFCERPVVRVAVDVVHVEAVQGSQLWIASLGSTLVRFPTGQCSSRAGTSRLIQIGTIRIPGQFKVLQTLHSDLSCVNLPAWFEIYLTPKDFAWYCFVGLKGVQGYWAWGLWCSDDHSTLIPDCSSRQSCAEGHEKGKLLTKSLQPCPLPSQTTSSARKDGTTQLRQFQQIL